MRILHVVPTYIPAYRYGGPIYSVHNLCRNLVERKHEVDVYTTNVDGDQNRNVVEGEVVDLDGVKVRYFACQYVRRLYYSSAMMKALRVHAKDYDLIHLHSVFLWPTWAAARMARRNNVPYILSPRGMLVKELIMRKNRILKTVWITLIERNNIAGAATVHLTSDAERNDLSAFVFRIAGTVVIPNGVENLMDWNKNEVSKDILEVIENQPLVLFLGRINWKKGLDRLIKAMTFMQDVQLVIAGNDEEDYLPGLQRLVAENNLESHVSFVPRNVSGADKEALYAAAKVFVLPSYSENFGNTVLEAMIRSVPVVVTPEVGAAEVVQNSCSGLVVDGDPKIMGNAIRELLGDESEMARMGVAGKVEAESNYTWSKISESMSQLYDSIIDQGS